MNFDLGELRGTPGEKLHVTAVEFFETSVVVQDSDGIQYRAYYDQQPKWQTIGRPYLGQVGCKLYGEVGQGSTEGKLLRFFVREFISLPQPKQTPLPFDVSNDIPRSPYDVVTAQLDKTMSSIDKAVNQPITNKSIRARHVNFDPSESVLIGNYAIAEGLNFKQAASRLVRMGISFDKQ